MAHDERIDEREVIADYFESLLDELPEEMRTLARGFQRSLVCVGHHQTIVERDLSRLGRDVQLLRDTEQVLHRLIYRVIDIATTLSAGKQLFDAAGALNGEMAGMTAAEREVCELKAKVEALERANAQLYDLVKAQSKEPA